MTKKITIAIDAMGGENSPKKNIEGLKFFLDKRKTQSDFVINLYGDKNLIENELKKNNLPYLVCFTDPTAGGFTASFASLSDISLAEPNSLIAFAGRRVIQATVKEDLPENFQRSEYVQECGFVDIIIQRKDIKEKIASLLSILLKKKIDINSLSDETSENNITIAKAAS